MKAITVDLGTRSYPIYVEAGNLKTIGELTQAHQSGPKIALITDENVGALYQKQVEKNLREYGFQVSGFVLPAGEQTKCLEQADALYEKLIEDRFDRNSTVLALGGGVIGDLAGFIAATFMRGIRYIQIPTTLLSQTDSSVGGKVGINHRLGKNLIGAFYQPNFVLIDPLVLKSLPLRERWAGMAEVLKYGLIADGELFDYLSENLEDLIHLENIDNVATVIERCCRIKADVVQQDERESGLRRILNFGHTVGHALEALTDFAFYKHGEAVIVGMRAMTRLSQYLDLITFDDFSKIDQIMQRVPLPKPLPHFTPDEILQKIYLDKKVIDNKLNVVLLEAIGKAIVKNDLDKKYIISALEWIKEKLESNS